MTNVIQRTIEQGKREGQFEAKLETARRMKELGLDEALILQATGLSREELVQLTDD